MSDAFFRIKFKDEMLKFLPNPTNQAPPDGYVFVFPEDGFRAEAITYGDWKEVILKHYLDNAYLIPNDYMRIAEDQLCQKMPPGHCIFENGEKPKTFVSLRFSVTDVVHGTAVMIDWTLNGNRVVEPAEAERRADICSKCYFNGPVEGCGPCHLLAETAANVSGAKVTASDQFLRACAVCKCSNKAQVWVPIEHLAKGVTDEQMKQFPTFCWKRQDLESLS